jgi:hypothetical protein
LTDLESGSADATTLINDAAQLAVAAQGNGDVGLAYIARNIGNAAGEGTDPGVYLADLANTAPGTQGAKNPPQGPFAQADDLGNAYLKLENDVEGNADPQTLLADASQVKTLADQEGNTALSAVAGNIIASLGAGTGGTTGAYNPLWTEIELMSNGASGQDIGTAPPNENDAYQKLLSDIKAGAANSTVTADVVALSRAAIGNGDFGLAQTALDIGDGIKATGSYDSGAATKALDGVAPGTQAAQQPPVSDSASAA